MPEEQNYYEEMGIPLDATESRIREAYKKLAKKYHPDLNPDMPRWAANQMKKLNIMYDTLSNPIKKQDYDKKIGKIKDHATSSHSQGYSSQWDETRHKSKTNQKTSEIHKRFGYLSTRTLKNAAIGMFTSGLIAFLVLSFLPVSRQTGLPIVPSSDEQRTVYDKRATSPTSLPQPNEKVEHAPLNNEDAEVHYKQGIDYIETGMSPEAIAEFEKAIAINPEHFRAHAYLGFAYGVVGRLDEATREYEKAINIKPDYADAYYGLAMIYDKKGMFDRAERELEIYKWLTEDNPE